MNPVELPGRFPVVLTDDVVVAVDSSSVKASVWATRDGAFVDLLVPPVRGAKLTAIAVHPDGRTVALGTAHGGIFVMKIGQDEPIVEPQLDDALAGAVSALSYSADGGLLAVGISPSTGGARVIALDSVTGAAVRRPVLMNAQTIDAVAFGSDNRTLAIATTTDPQGPEEFPAGEVILIDLDEGLPVGPLATGTVKSLAYDAETATIVAFTPAGWDRWIVDPDEWMHMACGIANRNLTTEEWDRYLGSEPYRPTCPDVALPPQ
jgi:WD40 repeat protein